jgi:hypothetical protein
MYADNVLESGDSGGACLACEAEFESVKGQVASLGTKRSLPRHPNLRTSAFIRGWIVFFAFIRGPIRVHSRLRFDLPL